MTIFDLQDDRARGSPAPDSPSALDLMRAAAVQRHPSSNLRADVEGCSRCGFAAPAMDDVATALATIPDQWADLLDADATRTMIHEAARLRDELHVVANRISRVLADPGSAVLASARIDSPTSWARSTDPGQVLALMRLAADRLAAVLGSLDPPDWQLTGRAGRLSLSILELAVIPLHHSHARLTRGRTCR